MAEGKSLRDQILASDDITEELVDVPEWGVKVQVRSMTGLERAQAMNLYVQDDGSLDPEKLYPALIVATTFDPVTGERVFKPEDAGTLNTKNSAALERIARVAMRLSGLGADAVDEAGKES